MNNVLPFLLSCQLLQQIFAQVNFGTGNAPAEARTYIVNQQCQCYPGSTCPTGTNGIDIRIVNTGTTCPSGQVYCCSGCSGCTGCSGCIGCPGCCSGCTNNPPCGTQRISPSSHPVGQAAYGAYPWMVAILTTSDGYVGGGVLIGASHVLTVAHKVAGYVNRGIKVRLGDWDIRSTTEPYPSVEISVSGVTIYKQYNSTNLQNDIAVLRLSSAAPIATAPNINTACLPSGQVAVGTRCWVTGWGKNAFTNGMNPAILKEVDVPVLSQTECQSRLRGTRLGGYFVLDSSFMCAGGEAGKDACTDDGGSPLVCSVNGAYQVVGLVTWGIGCADGGVPGVYTNVNNFYSWIVQQMA